MPAIVLDPREARQKKSLVPTCSETIEKRMGKYSSMVCSSSLMSLMFLEDGAVKLGRPMSGAHV